MIDSASNSNSKTADAINLPSTTDVWELLWRRKLVVSLGIAVGFILGLLYWLQAAPEYESVAQVLVVQKRPTVVTGEQRYESHFQDYVATHLALIVSPLIVERAIETSDLGALKMFSDVEEVDTLTDVIIGQLEARGGARDLGENAESIMSLAFRGADADECPLVVQAVLDSYQAFLSETYRGMSDDAVGLISQARDLLKNDLEQQEEAYSRFRQQSPLLSRGTDEINPLQDRLTAIETQRSQLLLRRTEFEKQLLSIQNARKDGGNREQLLAMVADLRNLTATGSGLTGVSTTLENNLVQLLDREQELLEHYGPNHPHVVTVRQQIAATRQYLALPTTAHVPEPNSLSQPDGEAPSEDPVQIYTRYLEQELDRIQISEKLLTDLYEREHEAAKELSTYQLKDERFRRNLDRTQQLYDGVIRQLQEASLIKDYGGFEARVIAPPKIGYKVSPRTRIVFPGFMFGGMLLGVFVALVAELSDKSFHSREEIQSRLGLPVVGQIPDFAAAAEAQRRAVAGEISVDPMLCTFIQRRSPQAEAYRALWTTLFFSQRGDGRRVIQLTGPSPNDGTSLLAANLAVTIAQSGKRTLLIDADLRRPRQHEIFGVSPQKGLGSIGEADNQLGDAICKTVVDNLWLMTAGPLPPDPSEVVMSPWFAELIIRVRDQYEYVMIDSGPVLVVSDSCAIASRADGILLSLRLTKDSRRRAEAAKEVLRSLDAKLIGVVANDIRGSSLRGYNNDLYGSYDGYFDENRSSKLVPRKRIG